MDIISERIQTSNKQHQCTWCNQNIIKGRKYKRHFMSDNGHPYISKFHICCGEFIQENINHCINSDGFLWEIETVMLDEINLNWDELNLKVQIEQI